MCGSRALARRLEVLGEHCGPKLTTGEHFGIDDVLRPLAAKKRGHLSGDALLTAAVEENVLVQLEHLRTHPAVAARLARGRLNLHGWVYKLETGRVFAYDSRQHQFVPIEDVTTAPVESARLAVRSI